QDLVAIEDQLDDVADGRQLDERSRERESDVALELGALPYRNSDRDGDERQRRRDVAERDVDAGRHAATSRPPSSRNTRCASRSAWAESWVTRISDRPSWPRSRVSVCSTISRAVASRAEVGSSSSSTLGAWDSALASMTRCC